MNQESVFIAPQQLCKHGRMGFDCLDCMRISCEEAEKEKQSMHQKWYQLRGTIKGLCTKLAKSDEGVEKKIAELVFRHTYTPTREEAQEIASLICANFIIHHHLQ